MPHVGGFPEKLLLHISEVDAQHAELAGVLDRIAALTGQLTAPDDKAHLEDPPSLSDCVGSEQEPKPGCDDRIVEAVLELLDELEQLTSAHFADEEKLMDANGYPGLAEHRSEHMLLIGELREFIREVRSGRECLMQCHLVALKGWFFGHIVLADRAFGDFYHRAEARTLSGGGQ